MRRKLSILAAALIAGGALAFAAPAPAYACHEIMYSENPVHNWVCATVHETQFEEKIDGYYQELGEAVNHLYCTLVDDPACP